MTQNSDSGDAVGDAGPTTDRYASWWTKVKIGLIGAAAGLGNKCRATILKKSRINRLAVIRGTGVPMRRMTQKERNDALG
jgi:hypothetical protein